MTTKHETFSIGDTARMTGVSQKQLRHWEAREFISAPMRIVCGQRAYRYFTKRQVEQIVAIKRSLDEGYTLSHASRLARKFNGQEGS
jgi:MerR family transcriptional regulator, redox-sensitive transcriptional activator SoxR